MADLKKLLQSRNNRVMLAILLIGTAIILFSARSGGGAEQQTSQEISVGGEEERLSEILSQIAGAGEVSVLISYESTTEKDIAYDASGERAVTSGGDVVVLKERYPTVRGVVVIADGAADAGVKQKLKEAVTAVTGAAANRVCVYER